MLAVRLTPDGQRLQVAQRGNRVLVAERREAVPGQPPGESRTSSLGRLATAASSGR